MRARVSVSLLTSLDGTAKKSVGERFAKFIVHKNSLVHVIEALVAVTQKLRITV